MKDTAMLRMFIFIFTSGLFFWLLDQDIMWVFTMPILVIICAICVSWRDDYSKRVDEREEDFRNT